MARTNNQPTAADAYRALCVEIETQLDGLAEALERHHALAEAHPTYRSLVGDLTRVRDRLAETLGVLPKKSS